MAKVKQETARVLLVAAEAAGLEALRPARETLNGFGVAWTEALGKDPHELASVRAVIVASSDGALPGALAAATSVPVVRVPTADADRTGLALLCDPATSDLPAADAPFATVAIGEAGAKNAALFVVSVLALDDPALWEQWLAFRQRQTVAVLAAPPLSME